MYKGIDYGLGTANIDRETGIRYGVISRHTVGQEWYDHAEADYGEPTCPKCGNEPNSRSDFDYHAECGVYFCPDCSKVWYPMELDEGFCPECNGKCNLIEFEGERSEYACYACAYLFDSDEAYSDEPLGWNYDGNGYTLSDCLDNDIFVLKSPYYTFAQFCSPCVPGAGNLDNPDPDGVKCYCLGHEWFEEEKASYPVYQVSDDILINPKEDK